MISLLGIKTGVQSVNKFCREGRKGIKRSSRLHSLITRVKNIEHTLNNEQYLSQMLRDFPRRKLVWTYRAYCTDVFREVAVISRDDSRVESYSFDSLPTKRHRARWNAKRFRITTPGESRYIFFKASPAPYQRGPGAGGGAKRERNDGRKWETERERESPHMKPLSAPIQQYFYIYHPHLPLSVTPSTAIPLNLKPAT